LHQSNLYSYLSQPGGKVGGKEGILGESPTQYEKKDVEPLIRTTKVVEVIHPIT
jgi:hypothetical protein